MLYTNNSYILILLLLLMSKICKHCGEYDCKEHSFNIGKPIKISEFSGSSPPEIFIGRWNYPNVYTGILSPQDQFGNTQQMSSPELWHTKRLPISKIMQFRNQLIYGRTQSNIKKLQTRFLSVMSEIAMTHKSISTEFKLKKPISQKNIEKDSRVPLISNAAQIQSARLQENAKIKPKVDYLVNDTDLKSAPAILELHKQKTPVSNIIKILSSGLLGLKKNRKLVPTRWSITATDDTISKNILQKVKLFPEIPEFQVFYANYLGNYYNFLLIPDKYSFEVIEMRTNHLQTGVFWQDYESFFPRKKYADNVTGAYYANRLALMESLQRVKRQAQCLVIREIRPEYYAPCGVGILRESSRAAFQSPARKFNTLQEALQDIQSRLKQPITNYTKKSWLLNQQRQQRKLIEFFN
jgi:DNA repair protein NreA